MRIVDSHDGNACNPAGRFSIILFLFSVVIQCQSKIININKTGKQSRDDQQT